MKIIDLENIKIVDVKDYKIEKLFFPMKSFMDMSLGDFSQVFKRLVNKKMREVELEENMIISIETDLFRNDFEIMRDIIMSHVINFILEPEQRNREKRLGIPKEFDEVDLKTASIMDLLNKKTKINRFNISATAKSNIGRSSLV